MKHTEKRNEIVIHGVFILVVMILCLVSTVTFALAAESDPPNQPDLSNVSPDELHKYISEHPNNIPPEVLAEMQRLANDPNTINEINSGVAGETNETGVPSLPLVDPAAFTLTPEAMANMTPDQLVDFELMQQAMANGDEATARELFSKYEGEGYGDFPNQERGDFPFMENSEQYEKWMEQGGYEGEHSEHEGGMFYDPELDHNNDGNLLDDLGGNEHEYQQEIGSDFENEQDYEQNWSEHHEEMENQYPGPLDPSSSEQPESPQP